MAVVAAAFVVGLFVGSFLNVCIWRLPREEQVVRGRSRCPACRRTIAWHDNIPVVSFMLLRGRCRACGIRISWRYPLVELITGVAIAATAARWGLTVPGCVYAVLTCALITASFIDASEQIIPDVITLPGVALAVAASVAWPSLHQASGHPEALGLSLLGALAGGGSIWGMGALGQWCFKKEAMGGGDVKLMALLGALLGWQRILLVFFLAPILGSVVGLPMKLRHGDELIPYGPFLSVAALVALWWGDGMIAWYWHTVGGF